MNCVVPLVGVCCPVPEMLTFGFPETFWQRVKYQAIAYLHQHQMVIHQENILHYSVSLKIISLIGVLKLLTLGESANKIKRMIDQGAVEIDGVKIPPGCYHYVLDLEVNHDS